MSFAKTELRMVDLDCASKLLYSLEALQPTEATASKLDTNEEVYRRANVEARTDRENTIRPLSQVLQEKRIKLLGHIVRRPREHPQHQTTFYTRSLIPRTVDKRRVGRPRLSWTHETMKVAWNLSQGYPFNVQDREMRRTLQEMAQNRIPPNEILLPPCLRVSPKRPMAGKKRLRSHGSLKAKVQKTFDEMKSKAEEEASRQRSGLIVWLESV